MRVSAWRQDLVYYNLTSLRNSFEFLSKKVFQRKIIMNKHHYKIAVIAGDGIGKEVMLKPFEF